MPNNDSQNSADSSLKWKSALEVAALLATIVGAIVAAVALYLSI